MTPENINKHTRRMDHADKKISHILIVDDDEELCQFLQQALLVTKEYSVDSVSNGNDALEMLESQRYDVILLDIFLAGMSGKELLAILKKLFPETAVVMITGAPDLDDAVELLKQGATDYLAKPIEVEKLYSCVKQAICKKLISDCRLMPVLNRIPEEYKPVKVITQTINSILVLVEKKDQYYAMKIINSEFVDDNTRVRRFYREMKLMKQINHPNIVKVYDYNMTVDKHLPYILMEYVPGTGFYDYINENPPMEERIKVFQGMIAAVGEVHRNHIIHRDIKTDNFLFSTEKVPKLTDFGLSKIKNSNLTMTSEISGTLNFMAPEMFESLKKVDYNADIFSLGVVGYILFTGQNPFTGRDLKQIMISTLTTKPLRPDKINPEVPSAIQDILAKMLEKDQKQRYQRIEDVMQDLNNYNEKTMKAPRPFFEEKSNSTSAWS